MVWCEHGVAVAVFVERVYDTIPVLVHADKDPCFVVVAIQIKLASILIHV